MVINGRHMIWVRGMVRLTDFMPVCMTDRDESIEIEDLETSHPSHQRKATAKQQASGVFQVLLYFPSCPVTLMYIRQSKFGREA